ncbi:MAG: response regulator, partial [Nitrospirae bacterium]
MEKRPKDATEKLRVLFIEDMPDDVFIAEHELKRAGLAFNSQSIKRLEELAPAIEEFSPDIIISDYNLPGFTALDVLKEVKALGAETPFIVLTASVNEEVAVECLKAGADDYILKGQLARLPHAIKEAIRKRELEREKRDALKKLAEAEERYRYIAMTISDYAYAFRVEEDGTMRGEWISDAFYREFGLTLPDIDRQGGWQSVVYPEDLPRALEHAKRVLSGREDTEEFRFVTKDGRARWLRDYAMPVIDKNTGRVVRIYGASQDITDIKEAEESLKK